MAETILIVDDSVSMRQMTSIILKNAGYTVEQAADGEEGLSKVSDDISLVITDYNMPGMNGIELIKKIRAGSTNKAVPILMLTTESEESKKNEGKNAGATGWLTKPFDKEKLLSTIKKIMGSVSF
ncbi:MAG: response regulator [Spirochaetes bacterium]|nr:response regulator [Spirochaetota bacterium]